MITSYNGCGLFLLDFEKTLNNVVWRRESGTEKKTGGGDGGGRVEDVTICVSSDKNGQDQE